MNSSPGVSQKNSPVKLKHAKTPIGELGRGTSLTSYLNQKQQVLTASPLKNPNSQSILKLQDNQVSMSIVGKRPDTKK